MLALNNLLVLSPHSLYCCVFDICSHFSLFDSRFGVFLMLVLFEFSLEQSTVDIFIFYFKFVVLDC